jgi:hypothetical protein
MSNNPLDRDQILQLTDGNLVAGRLLYYFCRRHDECVEHLPSDARASIVRPYTIDQLWQSLDQTVHLDEIANALLILLHKNFIRFYDDRDDSRTKWLEVYLPNIQSAIEFVKTFPEPAPHPPLGYCDTIDPQDINNFRSVLSQL